MSESNTRTIGETLWGFLSREERISAVEGYWNGCAPEDRKKMLVGLAEVLGFREAFIRAQRPEWKLETLAKNMDRWPLTILQPSVRRQFLIAHCGDMIRAILDAEGTPRDDILIAKDAAAPSAEALMRGIRHALQSFPARDVLIYYDLHLDGGEHWKHLAEVVSCEELTTAFRLLLDGKTPKAEPPSPPSPPPTATPAPAEVKAAKPAVPEPFETGFTILDRILLRHVVACAAEAEGALTPSEAEGLIDEVVALAPERHRSHFHAGFLDSMLGRELRTDVPAANAARRSWRLVGHLMGMARDPGRGRLSDFIQGHGQVWAELLKDAPTSAKNALLGLVPSLIGERAWGLLARVLSMAGSPMDPRRIENTAWFAFKAATGLVQAGQMNEAIPILEGTLRLSQFKELQGRESVTLLRLGSMRRLGQAHLRSGRFEEAQAFLSRVDQAQGLSEGADTKVDLALARARFRSIEFLLPAENADSDKTVLLALERIQAMLHDAVAMESNRSGSAPGAHFILGLTALHRGESAVAEQHLGSAHLGMIYARETYEPAGLIDWVRFLLSIALSEQCQPVRLNEIRAHIDAAVQSPINFPLRLWHRLCRSLSLYDDRTLAETAVRHILSKRGDKGIELLRETGVIASNATLRDTYRTWLRSAPMATARKAEEFERLLDMAIASKESEEAAGILDTLEGFARSDSVYAERFLVLVANRRSELLALWSEEDIDLSVAALLDGAGRIGECLAILRRVFHKARLTPETGTPGALLSQMERLRMPESELGPLRLLVAPTGIDVPEPGHAIDLSGLRVLYVGGNEVQRQYEEQIRARLGERHPGLSMTFYYPGWSSNWNVQLEKVAGELPDHDIVVIHRFVRTQFGRTLRALCGPAIPWRSCTGTGRQSIETAILEAAGWIRRLRSQQF